MILRFIKPFLFVLLFPVLRAGIQLFSEGEINNILGAEITAFVLIIVVAALKCFAFRLIYDGKEIFVKTGLIFVKRAKLKVSKLSSVQTARNPFDAIFGAMTFRINTEAGTENKPDFEFKLKFSDGKQLARELYGEQTVSRQHFSAFKVAFMAAATSSAFTGIVIGVPVIYRAGNLFGIALSEVLLNEINNISSKIETHFPPVVNTVSLLLLLAYGVSFLYSFIKYLNFHVILGESKLEVRSGFFIRTRTAFKKASVNSVLVEQTPLMLLLKRYSMKASVGGFADSKSESRVVVPAGKYDDVKENLSQYFPFLAPEGRALQAKRSRLTESRFLFWPAIYFLIVLAVSITTALIFDEFTRFILFLTVIFISVVIYYAYICVYEYEFGKIRFGDNILAQSSRGLRTRELYFPKEKVGQIK